MADIRRISLARLQGDGAVPPRPILCSATIITLMALCSLAEADDTTWFCSVADANSKPQIMVYKIVDSNLIVNDWRDRLARRNDPKKQEGETLQLLENSSQAIIAVRAKPVAGGRSDVATRTVLIDRRTGQVRDITVPITGPLEEINGTCMPGN
jgi:hypothetical protein